MRKLYNMPFQLTTDEIFVEFGKILLLYLLCSSLSVYGACKLLMFHVDVLIYEMLARKQRSF